MSEVIRSRLVRGVSGETILSDDEYCLSADKYRERLTILCEVLKEQFPDQAAGIVRSIFRVSL